MCHIARCARQQDLVSPIILIYSTESERRRGPRVFHSVQQILDAHGHVHTHTHTAYIVRGDFCTCLNVFHDESVYDTGSLLYCYC